MLRGEEGKGICGAQRKAEGGLWVSAEGRRRAVGCTKRHL